jgi:hypothetical protein
VIFASLEQRIELKIKFTIVEVPPLLTMFLISRAWLVFGLNVDVTFDLFQLQTFLG